MILATTTDDVVGAAIGTLFTVVAALGFVIAKTREQISKMQEWQRIHDRRENHEAR